MTDRERFLLKRRLTELQRYEGSSTSMVTLYIRGGYQIPLVTSMLVEENSKSSNIKDRVNRQSVQEAIGSALEKLKTLPPKAPEHGLCLFSGSVLLADGRTKKVVYLIQPPRDVGTYYRCDKNFHVDALLDMFEDERRYGFLIVDGNGALYGLLTVSTKRVASKFTVDLSRKHNKGGQSSLRFERLRREQRHNYERKVCEQATTTFLTDNIPNVAGLFIAGSAEFKHTIYESALLDPRLKAIVKATLDIQYGGELGFNQAIELAQPMLGNLKLAEEATIVTEWMTAVTTGDDKIVFGLEETLHAYTEGVVARLLLWDQLPHIRYVISNGEEERVVVRTSTPQLERGETLKDEQILVEYLVEHLAHGTELHLVSNCTAPGTQFCKGFGGLGGYLRYAWRPESEHLVADQTDVAEDFI